MVDLSIGGSTWAGWHFGKFGRAREWRLHAPNGCDYQASEILNLRALLLDANFYRQRVIALQDYATDDALHFGPMDAALLLQAAEMIARKSREISLTGIRRKVRAERLAKTPA